MTLVSILGDFHSSVLPIYYQFRKKIKRHIIIYDDSKHDVLEAQNIIYGIKKFNQKYKINVKTHTHCIDEDSYEAIIRTVDFIKEHHKKKKDLFINTTDGLSNINNVISVKLLPYGANLISYDRYENEVNIIANENMTSYKVDDIIPIMDHFLLRNIYVEDVGDKKFAKKHSHQLLLLFENHYKEFKKFANYVQNEIYPTLDNKKTKNINKLIEQMGIVNLKKNQGLITGGLFEYYIYLKLCELDFNDIQIGVTVRKYIDKKNFIPNEFDLLIMKDNHLHMIECKFTKNIDLNNIVYKYMGLKSLLDDDGKICIVTSHKEPKIINEINNPVSNLPYKRALENKIMLKGNPIDDINKFIKDIKKYFEL